MGHLVIPHLKRARCGSRPMRRTSEAGQSMVLLGLLSVVLIGMLALVMDGGYAFLQRRGAQTAADAGALAGAREMCRSGDTTLATQVALDYAITRNRALEADVFILDGEVEVTTRNPFPTFFGRVLGRASITSSAIAAANCFPPGNAAGVLPIAWNCPPDETYPDSSGTLNCDIQYGPGQPYIIMNSKKTGDDATFCISDGGTVDCDPDNDGYDELLAGGNRSWLDLTGSGSDAGDGSAELVNWIKNGFPGTITMHTWFAGQPGVSNNVFMSVDSLLYKRVLLPVYDAVIDGPPPLGYHDPPDSIVWSNGASTTYYHVITFSIFVPTCVHATGADKGCNLYNELFDQGILDPNDKTIEGYFVEGTVEGLGAKGELYAGAYTLYLTR